MICAKCGLQNAENARFCTSCGAPLKREDNVQIPVWDNPAGQNGSLFSHDESQSPQDGNLPPENTEPAVMNAGPTAQNQSAPSDGAAPAGDAVPGPQSAGQAPRYAVGAPRPSAAPNMQVPQAYGAYTGGEPIKNHLALSIVSLFFFLILGIIAIIYSNKVDSSLHVGNYGQAAHDSKTAKTLAITGIAIGCGIAFIEVLAIVALHFFTMA